ncbi:hypothetical protein [Sphingosinicella sp. BN140058]|uniref:hypothetical protein n=1 Tax=Sphingosinicella sp. BN140058 TaxID=1892855 RepID=UPI00101366B5|nr:hypothetical protein [Sphingosinicella sp. BN140058]QAY78437.1 hypothetical protein ETR14_19260 [Sphingosinicella sp. BN140058]
MAPPIDRGPDSRRIRSLIPTTAAILSLAGAAWISIAAFHIAGGARHCLARSDDGPAPIDGLWDLRIFAFYTTGSGYKNTSRWYFHGLLVVGAPGGREVYNWSPRRLRFDRLQRPDIFIHNVRAACEP